MAYHLQQGFFIALWLYMLVLMVKGPFSLIDKQFCQLNLNKFELVYYFYKQYMLNIA